MLLGLVCKLSLRGFIMLKFISSVVVFVSAALFSQAVEACPPYKISDFAKEKGITKN